LGLKVGHKLRDSTARRPKTGTAEQVASGFDVMVMLEQITFQNRPGSSHQKLVP
jgi:hypothetical protein